MIHIYFYNYIHIIIYIRFTTNTERDKFHVFIYYEMSLLQTGNYHRKMLDVTVSPSLENFVPKLTTRKL